MKTVWTEELVKAAIFKKNGGSDGSHTVRFMMTLSEELAFADHTAALLEPPTRNQQRLHIKQVLQYRLRQVNAGRNYQRLNKAALAVVNNLGVALPSDTWFAGFYTRHSDILVEVGAEDVKVDRYAAMQEAPIIRDFEDMEKCFVARGMLKADGSKEWKHTPGEFGDDNGTRTPGWISRCKTIQVDETGMFMFYNRQTGKLKRIRRAVAKEKGRAIIAANENRAHWTYVPWSDANGHVIMVQIIFAGAGALVGDIVKALEHKNVLIQYTATGNQSGETFAEALRYLDMYLRIYHKDVPQQTIDLIMAGWRCVSTDGAARAFLYNVLQVATELRIDLCIRLAASSFITYVCFHLH